MQNASASASSLTPLQLQQQLLFAAVQRQFFQVTTAEQQQRQLLLSALMHCATSSTKSASETLGLISPLSQADLPSVSAFLNLSTIGQAVRACATSQSCEDQGDSTLNYPFFQYISQLSRSCHIASCPADERENEKETVDDPEGDKSVEKGTASGPINYSTKKLNQCLSTSTNNESAVESVEKTRMDCIIESIRRRNGSDGGKAEAKEEDGALIINNDILGQPLSNDDGGDDSSGYRCAQCGKTFSYAYYRDKHLRYTRCIDDGHRKFPCSLCDRSFEKRDRLRIHILHVHENHRPHVCTVCGKAFSQSSSLNKHLRVHSGERPYHCLFCTKSFTASSILRTHIRQHSGEKPFKCAHCGKSFASHAAHDSHVRRTHSALPHPGITKCR